MIKDDTTNEEIVLNFSKEESKNLILERLKIAEELIKMVSEAKIKSQIDELNEKYYSWNDYNTTLLKKIFSSNTIANEYSEYGSSISIIGGEYSIEKEKKRFNKGCKTL